MNVGLHHSWLITALIGVLVVWRVGLRILRLTTRQPLRLSALRWRIGLLGVLFIALALFSTTHLQVFAALLAGAVVGVFVGWLALKWSTLERTPEGFFYTPHRGVGGAIALIFVARLGYRWFVTGGPGNAAQLGLSPLTLAIFGLLVGYNISYSLGILRWRERELRKDPPKVEAGIIGAAEQPANDAPPP